MYVNNYVSVANTDNAEVYGEQSIIKMDGEFDVLLRFRERYVREATVVVNKKQALELLGSLITLLNPPIKFMLDINNEAADDSTDVSLVQ